jgi:hypothetical protein
MLCFNLSIKWKENVSWKSVHDSQKYKIIKEKGNFLIIPIGIKIVNLKCEWNFYFLDYHSKQFV